VPRRSRHQSSAAAASQRRQPLPPPLESSERQRGLDRRKHNDDHRPRPTRARWSGPVRPPHLITRCTARDRRAVGGGRYRGRRHPRKRRAWPSRASGPRGRRPHDHAARPSRLVRRRIRARRPLVRRRVARCRLVRSPRRRRRRVGSMRSRASRRTGCGHWRGLGRRHRRTRQRGVATAGRHAEHPWARR